jgi:integrase
MKAAPEPPRKFTDAFLANLKPEPKRRYAVSDTLVPGLRVRVSPAGGKVFILWKRKPGAPNPSAIRIGKVGSVSLADARQKARDWIEALDAGDDPKEVEARKIAEKARAREHTFGSVAERYIDEHLASKRRGADDAREIRKFLIGADRKRTSWRDKPITEITPLDVKKLIKPLGKATPAQAHLVLGHIKRIFSWALNDDVDYGLTASPAQLLKPIKLIGRRKIKERVLTDDELFAYWRAAGRLGYPMGPLFRLMALTGTRISEVAEAHRDEFDLRNRLWTIPKSRFKSEHDHPIPISSRAQKLLEELPSWTKGGYLFSSTAGATPVNGPSKAKARLDKRMLRTLRALARIRGEKPPTRWSKHNMPVQPGEIERFTNHDIRRTVRTRLSDKRLGVAFEGREMVIGHGKKGLARIYDQAEHLPEMREALERWADWLMEIVGEAPPPERSNVISLKASR